MRKCLTLMVCLSLLQSGCRTPPLEPIDKYVAEVVSHPFDVAPTINRNPADFRPTAPAAAPKPGDDGPAIDARPPGAANPSQDPPRSLPPPDGASRPLGAMPARAPALVDASPPTGVTAPIRTTFGKGVSAATPPRDNILLTSYTEIERAAPSQAAPLMQKFELTIPKAVPGAEAPLVTVPAERTERTAAIARLYPELPLLTVEPVARPGPNGRPYTLADLQRLAAANNPLLRQAASDVEAARGLMIQAGLYPNPTVGYETNPDNNNTGSGVQGGFIDQVIKTGGKLTIAVAGARMGLIVAELALKRARYNLATTIRGDYYTLLVAKETVRVNRGLVHFTDEIFRLQADLAGGGFAGAHEPAALRSQAFIVRLAHKQSLANYIYAWKQLVADIGMRQLPLSEVEGQVDRLIPYFDYDEVLARVLANHTDILTARANLTQARYNLKGAQVVPIPDVEVRADLFKEHMIQPLQNYFALSLGIPFPIWDRNQGNIMAATAAMVRAQEGPHAAEVNLTTNLAAAYATYKNNLMAMEYYRRNVLPDMVRYYRGVFERRKIDPTAAFGDLVAAQQFLVADVTSYLGVLGSLWTSVVAVADFLQTDDLFQLGKKLEVPQLPDLEGLHPWACPHPNIGSAPVEVQTVPHPGLHDGVPTARAPTAPQARIQESRKPKEKPTSETVTLASDAVRKVSTREVISRDQEPAALIKRSTRGQTPPTKVEAPTARGPGALTPLSDPVKTRRDPGRPAPMLDPPWLAPPSTKAPPKQFAKLLGVDEPSFGTPPSAAAPPVERPSDPFTPDAARRPDPASSMGGAL
jgi:cobalt-zinc-cadmium efflux system outer membrane protein